MAREPQLGFMQLSLTSVPTEKQQLLYFYPTAAFLHSSQFSHCGTIWCAGTRDTPAADFLMSLHLIAPMCSYLFLLLISLLTFPLAC